MLTFLLETGSTSGPDALRALQRHSPVPSLEYRPLKVDRNETRRTNSSTPLPTLTPTFFNDRDPTMAKTKRSHLPLASLTMAETPRSPSDFAKH